MRNPGLPALLAAALAAAAAGLAVPASALAPAQEHTARALRLESAQAAVAAAAVSPEDASGAARKGFDGAKPGGLPVTVEVLQPLETIPVPGTRAEQPAPQRPSPAPSLPPGAPRAGDSYHFEGRRTAIPNLTIYTPVKDKPGEDGSTRAPAGKDWKTLAVKALPYLGAAATVGGLFFPPLLFLGGLLLGAWGAMKLLSRD